MTSIIYLIALLSVSAFLVVLVYRYNKLTKKAGTLATLAKDIEVKETYLKKYTEDLEATEKTIAEKQLEKSMIDAAIVAAKDSQAAAVELAAKQLELERERKLADFKAGLDAEMAEIAATSPKAILYEELTNINSQIEIARQTLMVQQEQAMNAAKEEDFVNFHSIDLTPQDTKDINLIRQFAPQLTRQEAFFKLIWTEFYQKPIQALCKILNAEKVEGIYKITNTSNGRMYIGQAVDIASRWKEHCKCGLGIGSTGYMTNKFYKALHDTGIENFTFEVLELCPKANLNDREFYWIDFYNATTFGYNSKIGG